MEIFKEISVGGVSKEELINRLIEKGVKFNIYAETLFKNPAFTPSASPKRLSLIKLKPSEVGIKNPYSLEQVIDKALHLQLFPCPLYLAAFLRLEFLDQMEGPYLTVASLRLTNDEDYPTGFYMRNIDGTLWLRGYRAIGECDHPIDNELIFMNKKSI